MSCPFPHDGSDLDERILADWLDDQGRHDEADEVRDRLDAVHPGVVWVYEYAGGGGE